VRTIELIAQITHDERTEAFAARLVSNQFADALSAVAVQIALWYVTVRIERDIVLAVRVAAARAEAELS
jgi:hypothetical protein